MKFGIVGFAAAVVLAGGSVQAAPSSIPQVIYQDSLQNGWQAWGWAKISYSNANPVHGGHSSISVKIDKGWDALSVHHNPFNTKGYSRLSFWVNGGPAGGQALQVQVTEKTTGGGAVNIPPIPAKKWTHITVPLSALKVAGRNDVDGFWFKDRSGKPLPVFYVDDISLVK